MTIRDQYYNGSCLAICIGEFGVDVKYPGMDFIAPQISEEVKAVVYVYLDFKEVLTHNIALCRDLNKDKSSLFKLMYLIRFLTTSLKNQDVVPNAEHYSVSRSQLKILSRADMITPKLYLDIFGNGFLDKVGTSDAEIVAFVSATAHPQTCLLLVEGNYSLAKNTLGYNLSKWRDVALAYSTGNACSPQHPVSLSSLVCSCESLDTYIDFYTFYSAQKIGNDRYAHSNYLATDPISLKDYAALYALLCLRFANGHLYSSLDTHTTQYQLNTMLDASVPCALESYLEPVRDMEYQVVGEYESILANLGGSRCTTAYGIYGLMSYPTDFDKGIFKTVCKLTTLSKAFPKKVLETKIDYTGFGAELKTRAVRAISIVIRAHVLKKFIESSSILERLNVDKESLAYSQLVNKGPVRKKVLQGLHLSTKRLKSVRDYARNKDFDITAADLSRLETVCSYFETVEQSNLLNCWTFNQTDALKMLFPEYCLTDKKLYSCLTVFDNSKPALKYMLDNKLESAGTPSIRVVSDTANPYVPNREWYSCELVMPFVLSELFCKGNINNFEYTENILGRRNLLSLDEIEELLPHIDSWGSLIESAMPTPVRLMSGKYNPLRDSWMTFPELWTKEFVSSISLEFLTGNKEDSMYDLLRYQVSGKLTKMLEVYTRLGYTSIAVKSYEVISRVKETSHVSAIEIVDNLISSQDARGTAAAEGLIVITADALGAEVGLLGAGSPGYYALDQKLLRALISMPVEDFLDKVNMVKLAECIKYALPSLQRIRARNGAPMRYIEHLEYLISKLET